MPYVPSPKMIFVSIKSASHFNKLSKKNNTRKISMGVSLSDPKDYKGGNFQFWFGDGLINLDKVVLFFCG